MFHISVVFAANLAVVVIEQYITTEAKILKENTKETKILISHAIFFLYFMPPCMDMWLISLF